MQLIAVVAMAQNRVIGKQNQLPWRMPADLQHFKSVTMGKPVIMGRKTYESIGRPLPGRLNIIVTRDLNYKAPGCEVVSSPGVALSLVAAQPEACLIGGSELYKQLLPEVSQIYLTVIHHDFDGDAYFPELDKNEWQEVSREDHQADENNAYDYSFIILAHKSRA